jgi:hypothetical protein
MVSNMKSDENEWFFLDDCSMATAVDPLRSGWMNGWIGGSDSYQSRSKKDERSNGPIVGTADGGGSVRRFALVETAGRTTTLQRAPARKAMAACPKK